MSLAVSSALIPVQNNKETGLQRGNRGQNEVKMLIGGWGKCRWLGREETTADEKQT